jgi:hypothetical protein
MKSVLSSKISSVVRYLHIVAAMVGIILNAALPDSAIAFDKVEKYQIYEIEAVAEQDIKNPFDVYLLKIELKRPDGRSLTIDGFFDGDGKGGQTGRVWKARICPDQIGVWKWKTIIGDRKDVALNGLNGSFECVESDDPGGVISDGKYMRFQDGGYVFLQGNFLDIVDGLPSTHVFFSEMLTDDQRSAILTRQRDFHNANKINVYFANIGDYKGIATTPWSKTESETDLTRMDIAAWTRYDRYIKDIKEAGMFAELWFFADDSGFGKLSQEDKNRLFRYGMARTSAFNHTLFVIALEWQEGWTIESLRTSGHLIQKHNPWKRLLSVHSIPVKAPDSIRSYLSMIYKKIFRSLRYSEEQWISFIASQAGNDAVPEQVNSLSVEMNRKETIPHISEEFGELITDTDIRLMRNMWASLCGGAAGGGTGSHLNYFMKFMQENRVPFQRMTPSNGLIDGGQNIEAFCLAEIGHHYLVYSTEKDFSLSIKGDGLYGSWYDPTGNETAVDNSFKVEPGIRRFKTPSETTDWVLWITDQRNLNSGPLYPSSQLNIFQARHAN